MFSKVNHPFIVPFTVSRQKKLKSEGQLLRPVLMEVLGVTKVIDLAENEDKRLSCLLLWGLGVTSEILASGSMMHCRRVPSTLWTR
jgi:hypothetical protein